LRIAKERILKRWTSRLILRLSFSLNSIINVLEKNLEALPNGKRKLSFQIVLNNLHARIFSIINNSTLNKKPEDLTPYRGNLLNLDQLRKNVETSMDFE